MGGRYVRRSRFGRRIDGASSTVGARDGSRVPGGGTAATATAQTGTDQEVPYADLGGTRFWQGGDVVVTGLEAGATYELRQVTGSQSSSFVRERAANERGALRIRTEALEGQYFLRGPGIEDERAEVFSVSRQTLSAQWAKRSIASGESTRLEVDSNRGQYTVAVSAGGLRFSDLRRIFAERHFADNFDARRSEDVILLSVESETPLSATFREVRSDSYTFTLSVVDSAASTTATVSVGQRLADASFEQRTVVQETGDVADVAVRMGNTRTAYLVIGGPGTNFLDVVELTDRNGDGRVTVRVNTRYAGLSPGSPGVPSNARPYRAAGTSDLVRMYAPGDRLAGGTTLGDLRSSLGIAAGLPRPLDAGDYELVLATTDDVRRDGQSLRVVDERDVGTLSLESPALDGAPDRLPERGVLGGGVPDGRHCSRV